MILSLQKTLIRAPRARNGPKGIACFFAILPRKMPVIPIAAPIAQARKPVTNNACHPNQAPIMAANLASPPPWTAV